MAYLKNILTPEALGKIWLLLDNLAVALIVFIIFYLLSYNTKKIIKHFLLKAQLKKELISFSTDTIFFVIMIVGVIVSLSTLGINTNAIVASLGLGGFAIGFALKDIIANAAAGFLILITKPFKTGDYIKVSNFEGIIKTINLRYTIISLEKNNSRVKILIPNNNLLTNILTIKKQVAKQ